MPNGYETGLVNVLVIARYISGLKLDNAGQSFICNCIILLIETVELAGGKKWCNGCQEKHLLTKTPIPEMWFSLPFFAFPDPEKKWATSIWWIIDEYMAPLPSCDCPLASSSSDDDD